MIRITKGDTVIECDNRADFLEAVAALDEYDSQRAARNTKPQWAVGGPVDSLPVKIDRVNHTVDTVSPWVSLPPELTLVPTESPDSEPKAATVQHVSVTVRNYEVLDAILAFPEGVGQANLCQLLGLNNMVVGGRLQFLKGQGLIEKIPGHRLWRATTLARRAKLVVG